MTLPTIEELVLMTEQELLELQFRLMQAYTIKLREKRDD